MSLDRPLLTPVRPRTDEEGAQATVVNADPPSPNPADRPTPRRIGGLRQTDVLSVVGAAIGSFGLASLLFILLSRINNVFIHLKSRNKPLHFIVFDGM